MSHSSLREGRWSALNEFLSTQKRSAWPFCRHQPGFRYQDNSGLREGIRKMFLACEVVVPMAAFPVTERRTMEDFANRCDGWWIKAYPRRSRNSRCGRSSWILRSLPHGIAVRVAFPAADCPADCQSRLEFLYTPIRQLLNMAEIRFKRTVPLLRQTAATRYEEAIGRERIQGSLVTDFNTAQATINWSYNTFIAALEPKQHRL